MKVCETIKVHSINYSIPADRLPCGRKNSSGKKIIFPLINYKARESQREEMCPLVEIPKGSLGISPSSLDPSECSIAFHSVTQEMFSSTCHVPGTILGFLYTAVDKSGNHSCPHDACILVIGKK